MRRQAVLVRIFPVVGEIRDVDDDGFLGGNAFEPMVDPGRDFDEQGLMVAQKKFLNLSPGL